MAYDNSIQADSDIFEKIKFIDVGPNFILSPPILAMLELEAKLYLVNSKQNDVKKFLPSVYVETEEEALDKLLNFSHRMSLKYSLIYCIRPKNQQIPIGYIHLDSPLTPTGLNSWSVDFWMGEPMRGKGLMSASLDRSMALLQEHNVPVVKALVHTDNLKCISVLERVGFSFVHQETQGEKRFLYSIRLN